MGQQILKSTFDWQLFHLLARPLFFFSLGIWCPSQSPLVLYLSAELLKEGAKRHEELILLPTSWCSLCCEEGLSQLGGKGYYRIRGETRSVHWAVRVLGRKKKSFISKKEEMEKGQRRSQRQDHLRAETRWGLRWGCRSSRGPSLKSGALTCGQGVQGAVAKAFLTTAKATMAGQLQGSLRAVPSVPGKLILAFFNTTLGTSCHTAGIDQVSLQKHRGQSSDSQLNLGGICP